MAIMWNGSLIPWIDANGDPYSGAKAYFFDAGTLTPMVTYTDAALSIPHDHPVVANSAGMFSAIFLVEQTTYRLRITTADDVTLWDVDNISAPTTVVPDPPSGGTAAEFLYQTGDIKMAWRTSSPTGYVRLNGRTIGAASSGATERANADCEDLFVFLWTEDANLAVSGGRGATAVGDWAAAKTIALPDWRGRTPLGMDSMGNTASGRVTDAQLGADSDTLGSAGGASTHTLIEAELAAHGHPVTVTDPGHRHFVFADEESSTEPITNATQAARQGNNTTLPGDWRYNVNSSALAATLGRTSVSATGITAEATDTGDGDAHNNLQPSVVIPFFIKL